jgi:hypothetical protein
MSKRYVIITQESELQETWRDPALPHLAFSFLEEYIDECIMLTGGLYVATYQPYVLEQKSIVNYHDPASTGLTALHLEAGVYGLRPSDPGMTYEEYQEFLATRV